MFREQSVRDDCFQCRKDYSKKRQENSRKSIAILAIRGDHNTKNRGQKAEVCHEREFAAEEPCVNRSCKDWDCASDSLMERDRNQGSMVEALAVKAPWGS